MCAMRQYHPIHTLCSTLAGVLACFCWLGSDFAFAADTAWLTGAAAQCPGTERRYFVGEYSVAPGLDRAFKITAAGGIARSWNRSRSESANRRGKRAPFRGAEKIAARLKIGVSMLGPVAYFGPRDTAWRLQTVAALRKDDISKLPSAVRSKWTRLQPWKWNDLSTPRDLLNAVAEQNKHRGCAGKRVTGALHRRVVRSFARASCPCGAAYQHRTPGDDPRESCVSHERPEQTSGHAAAGAAPAGSPVC